MRIPGEVRPQGKARRRASAAGPPVWRGRAPVDRGGQVGPPQVHQWLPAEIAGELDSKSLLAALQAVQNGNFSVRLPGDQVGLAGKIADTFNEIVAANDHLAAELERVGSLVGKKGQVRQRVRVRQPPRLLDRDGGLDQHLDRRPRPPDPRGHRSDRRRGARRPDADRRPRRRRASARRASSCVRRPSSTR